MSDTKTVVRLPDDPKDTAHEDLVAACLLAHGYFVESQLTLRHEDTGTEVLELDAIATPASDTTPEPILVGAKSGKSVPFETVFKLYGQRYYINLNRAWLLHRIDIPGDRQPVFDELSEGTGVTRFQNAQGTPGVRAGHRLLPSSGSWQDRRLFGVLRPDGLAPWRVAQLAVRHSRARPRRHGSDRHEPRRPAMKTLRLRTSDSLPTDLRYCQSPRVMS